MGKYDVNRTFESCLANELFRSSSWAMEKLAPHAESLRVRALILSGGTPRVAAMSAMVCSKR